MTKMHAGYNPGIDGLRAIAVLSVVIYHWKHAWLPGGFIGVDVFFVISGYVIGKSLAGSRAGGFREYILSFYKRRFLRIIPAMVFFLLATCLASTLFIPLAWLSAGNSQTAQWAFFGASNFFLVNNADGYFSQRIEFNPFIHTWSLAVEEQFYLIFPLLFYAWLRTRARSGAIRHLGTIVLPVVALCSLAMAAHQTQTEHDKAFYLLPSRFWELAAGALLFQWQSARARLALPSIGATWLAAAGMALLAVGFIFTKETLFPYPWALVPIAGTLLLIAAVTTPAPDGTILRTNGLCALLELRPVVYIGRISYSLYLSHWPVFTLFRWTVGLDGIIESGIAIALTFGLAAFSYHCVETPFRQNRFLQMRSNGGVVALGLATIVSSWFAAHVTMDEIYRLHLTVTKNTYIWGGYDIARDLPKYPSDGSATGRRVLLVGDSHAGAFDTMSRLAANSVGAESRLFTRPGCSIARLVESIPDVPQCRGFEQAILDWLKDNARPGDVLFLASLRVDRLADQWGAFDRRQLEESVASPARVHDREIALAQAAEFIRKAQALQLTVLMNAPMPVFLAPPFRCSDWFNRSNPICAPGFDMGRDELLKHREPAMQSLQALHESLGVELWDPFPILCGTPVCSAFEADQPIFADGDHLSGYGNRKLVPAFSERLRQIWKNGGEHAAVESR